MLHRPSRIDLATLEAKLNEAKIDNAAKAPTIPSLALRRPPTSATPTHSLPVTAEREKTHGDYEDTAYIAQSLKRVIWSTEGWRKMNEMQRESAEMICTKLSRMFAGNPNVKDHWDDIAGYAKLCSDRITEA